MDQRLALATSTDLLTWTKHPTNPVIELDPRWYERVEHDAWRDPWVFRDADGDGFHALITARARAGAPDARGVIGHAWSPDLLVWEVRPPLSEPGLFGHMEVPQVEVVDGTPVLLFSVGADKYSAARQARHPGEPPGTFVAIGETLLGPWDLANARQIPIPDIYSARLIRDHTGVWQVLGFIDGSSDDAFVGEIDRSGPVRRTRPGALVITHRLEPGITGYLEPAPAGMSEPGPWSPPSGPDARSGLLR